MHRRRKWIVAGVLLTALIVLAACAAGPNADVGTGSPPAGFWLGLWQGLISPITFLISLFTDKVTIYEVHNNGNWYDFGFMLGISVAFGAPARAGASAGRRRRAGSGHEGG